MTEQPELTDAQRSALSHWSTYGAPSEAAAERWIPTDDERAKFVPMHLPLDAVFRSDFDPVQTSVMLRGVGWQEMENKWVVWSDDPDADGRLDIHLNRSWTGNEIVRARLQLAADGSSQLLRLTWESDAARIKDMDQAVAWTTFVEVCRSTLGMKPSD
jgi:hypothetical protein